VGNLRRFYNAKTQKIESRELEREWEWEKHAG
jgi:hypothetical protein